MRVLAIEDNRPFLNLLRANLTKRGFTVDGTETLEDGAALASGGGYDAILVDLALPDGDGKQVVEMLRRARDPVPILVLSARGGIGDRVALLDLGADDYLVKPVDFEELAARIHAVVRRSAGRNEALQPGLAFADIMFDPRNRQAIVNGHPVELRPREAALLEALLRRAGEPVHREALLSSPTVLTRKSAPMRSTCMCIICGGVSPKPERAPPFRLCADSATRSGASTH